MKKIILAVALMILSVTVPAMALNKHCAHVLSETERTHVSGKNDASCFKKMLSEQAASSNQCGPGANLGTFCLATPRHRGEMIK
jgi:hypothetical protein